MTTKAKTKGDFTPEQVKAITEGWRLFNAALDALEEATFFFDELAEDDDISCGKAQRALGNAHMALDTAYSEGRPILPGGDW